jgi:hypothetical protein
MHNAPKYFNELNKCTKAKLVYIGHDLQFLSSQSNYDITKDKKYKNDSIKFKNIKTKKFYTLDIIFQFSTYETPYIKGNSTH